MAETIVQAKSEENLKQLIDSKNLLQQWAITRLGENPHYRIINESGPDHAKLFTAEVRLQGKVYGVGQGRRKQEAEKQAAEEALHKLGVRG